MGGAGGQTDQLPSQPEATKGSQTRLEVAVQSIFSYPEHVVHGAQTRLEVSVQSDTWYCPVEHDVHK